MKCCLLLIDIQNDYFPNGKMELSGMVEAADNCSSLLQLFRDRMLPLIHVQHLSTRPDAAFFLPDTEGAAINERVRPLESESVVEKHFPNSFRETELLAMLQAQGIDTLVICGAMSHMCIDATTRAAFDLGFSCMVAEDSCATRSLSFGNREVSASDVHASFMAALSVPYAQVLSTKEIINKLA